MMSTAFPLILRDFSCTIDIANRDRVNRSNNQHAIWETCGDERLIVSETDRIANLEGVLTGAHDPWMTGFHWFDQHEDCIYKNREGYYSDPEDLLMFADGLDGHHNNVATHIKAMDPLHHDDKMSGVAISIARNVDRSLLRRLPDNKQGFLDGWMLDCAYYDDEDKYGAGSEAFDKMKAFSKSLVEDAGRWAKDIQSVLDKHDYRIEVSPRAHGPAYSITTDVALWPKSIDYRRVHGQAFSIEFVPKTFDWRQAGMEDAKIDHVMFHWSPTYSKYGFPSRWYKTPETMANAIRREADKRRLLDF